MTILGRQKGAMIIEFQKVQKDCREGTMPTTQRKGESQQTLCGDNNHFHMGRVRDLDTNMIIGSMNSLRSIMICTIMENVEDVQVVICKECAGTSCLFGITSYTSQYRYSTGGKREMNVPVSVFDLD